MMVRQYLRLKVVLVIFPFIYIQVLSQVKQLVIFKQLLKMIQVVSVVSFILQS
jgi:hypothetical protein